MAERKPFSATDIAAAWQNSGGALDYRGNPTGNARCPYRYCRVNSFMNANSYGNSRSSDWVVDHKFALANGGSNNHSNLQAMHNECNAAKGDNY